MTCAPACRPLKYIYSACFYCATWNMIPELISWLACDWLARWRSLSCDWLVCVQVSVHVWSGCFHAWHQCRRLKICLNGRLWVSVHVPLSLSVCLSVSVCLCVYPCASGAGMVFLLTMAQKNVSVCAVTQLISIHRQCSVVLLCESNSCCSATWCIVVTAGCTASCMNTAGYTTGLVNYAYKSSQAALERSSQDAYDVIRLTRSKVAVWTVDDVAHLIEICKKFLFIYFLLLVAYDPRDDKN